MAAIKHVNCYVMKDNAFSLKIKLHQFVYWSYSWTSCWIFWNFWHLLPPIIQSIANQHYHHKYCVTLQSQDWFLKLYYLEIKWKLISICTLVHPVATGALLHKTDLVKRICHFLHVGCFILPQLSIWERPQNKQQTKVGCGKTFEHSLNSFWHNTGTL